MPKERFKAVPAVYLLFRRGGTVLFQLRENTGFMDGFYSFPAGHVDGGEPLTLAACREAKEEVGITLFPTQLRLVHTMHRNAADYERLDFFFEVKEWEGDIMNCEPEKCGGLEWFSLENPPTNVIDYLSQMLACVSRGEPYSEYGW